MRPGSSARTDATNVTAMKIRRGRDVRLAPATPSHDLVSRTGGMRGGSRGVTPRPPSTDVASCAIWFPNSAGMYDKRSIGSAHRHESRLRRHGFVIGPIGVLATSVEVHDG